MTSKENKSKLLTQMTSEEFKKLMDGYFAPVEKRAKMTEQEIKILADKLNRKIDVPLLNEETEAKILIRIVLKIDTFLYNNLPNEVYDLIRSSEDGIDDKEARFLTARLTKLINKNVDIPYIPEIMEQIAFEFLIRTIIDAARKSNCLQP